MNRLWIGERFVNVLKMGGLVHLTRSGTTPENIHRLADILLVRFATGVPLQCLRAVQRDSVTWKAASKC